MCARVIGAQRAAELREVLAAVAATGGCAALLSLTMRHRDGQRLAVLWTALAAAWRAVTSGRRIERERALWGVLGFVKVVEVTHGAAGWHVHVHCLVAFDGPVSLELATELGGRWFDRWSRALVRKGLAAPLEDRGGLDVRMVDMGPDSLDAMSDYLAKITAEITASSAKEGRDGNRSPFAILRDALATGLADDVELWWEWESGSHNRRQITWSRGLREWAGLHRERSDEEIVEEDRQGEDFAVIDPEDWPKLRDRVEDFLDIVEIDGPAAACAWLDAQGIRWSPPVAAPRPNRRERRARRR